MTDSENRGTDPKRHPRRVRIRLTRNLILYYRQSARGADKGDRHRDGYAKKIYQRTKNEAWSKPIETIGVIVVSLYTVFAGYQSCATRTANHIALRGLAATEGAVFKIQLTSDFGSRAERPAIGAGFTNAGKTSAKEVTGTLRINWRSAREDVLENEVIACRSDRVLPGTDLFGCVHYLKPQTASLLKDSHGNLNVQELSKETATIDVSITWDDGFGNVSTDSRCYFLFAFPNIYLAPSDPGYGKIDRANFDDCWRRKAYMDLYASYPSAIKQLKRYESQ